jgi:hypothetical protein
MIFFSIETSNGQTHGGDPPENSNDIQNHGEQLNRGAVVENVIETQDMEVDFESFTESPLAPSTALAHNAVVVGSAAVHATPSCVMNITVGENTQSLRLPIHETVFEDFSSGLFNNNFNVHRMDGRSIAPGECYSHYLDCPTSQLRAESNGEPVL